MKPKKHKRTRITEAAVDLVELAEKIHHGEPLTASQRRRVADVLVRIAGGQDLRSEMATQIEGKPPSGRPFWSVMDLLMHREYPGKKKAAIADVAKAWGIGSETLRGYASKFSNDALELIEKQKSKQGLAAVIAFHRQHLVNN